MAHGQRSYLCLIWLWAAGLFCIPPQASAEEAAATVTAPPETQTEVQAAAGGSENPAPYSVEDMDPELLLYASDIMVSTASKHMQKLSEVPGSVTIITSREIKERGALTLKELLLHTAGVEFEYDGIFETLRFRGIESNNNNKILVLVNGRKVNTVDIGDFEVNYGVSLDNVKRIEIVKGPGSALYGANAFSGIINIITKNGKEINGLSTTASLGAKRGDKQWSQYYQLTYGKNTGDWDYVVGAGYWREFGFDPINVDQPNDLYQGSRADLSLAYKDVWDLKAGFHKMDNPLYAYADNPNPRNALSQAYVDATYQLKLDDVSKIAFRVEDTYYWERKSWRTTFDIQRVKISSPADLPAGATIIVDEAGNITPATDAVGGYYFGLNDYLKVVSGTAVQETVNSGPMNEALAEVQYDLAWPNNNYLLLGVNFTADVAQQTYYSPETVSDRTYAGYIQDEYHMLDSLILLGGVRFDYNTAYGSNVSPRGSLIYTLLPGLRAKALYGSAFRKPDFMELNVQGDYGYYEAVGNPDLKPERIEQSEAGLEYELGKWLQLQGRYFYWETKDEIQMAYDYARHYIYSPDLSLLNPMLPAMPGFFYAAALNTEPSSLSWSNSNSRIGHGLEVEMNSRPFSFLKLGANYSLINLYARNMPEYRTWAGGTGQVVNGILGFNYENLFFANLYGHFANFPKMIGSMSALQSIAEAGDIESRWVWQYDFSLGASYRGFDFVFLVLNVFENPVAIDTTHYTFFKGIRTLRLNAMYTMNF